MKNEPKKRRAFLKVALGVLATFGLASVSKELIPAAEGKKIKMLTPDGKLVEVDESVVTQAGAEQHRASNKEVQDWMKTSKV